MIGSIFLLTPTLGWAWPAVAPIATLVAAGMGFRVMTESAKNPLVQSKLTRQMNRIHRVTIPLDDVITDVISEEVGIEERLTFERDEFLLVFRKDGRGKFHVEVSGPKSQTVMNLRIRGEEFARELVKKFAYHKMVQQIERRGASIVEEVANEADESVTLKARQWS